MTSLDNAARHTVRRLFGLPVENIAGALSADTYAAHRAHTQGERR